jgi:demethylmenaquinone methyltransferase/2-methoxy-6-polyprenyl-1,4-benzoquinol methylase
VAGRPSEQFSAAAAEERQELFNEIAPVYDQLNDLLSLGLHRVWKRAAVQWTGVTAGGRAIDVCCGSGDIALRLADVVGPSGQVVGGDTHKTRPFLPLAPRIAGPNRVLS